MPGKPVTDGLSVLWINPPRRFTSPSFKRMSRSIFHWPNVGWLRPAIVTDEPKEEISLEAWSATSPLARRRGVKSRFTPTAWY